MIDWNTWWWNEKIQRVLKININTFKSWQNEKGNERNQKKKVKKAVAMARAEA